MKTVHAVRDDPVRNMERREIIMEWKQPGLVPAAGRANRNREA